MRPIGELLEFLTKTMSMTDVYQPAVVLHLLERGGSSAKADLARTLAGYDESVQDYYERILMRWPKTTLMKHDVVTYDRTQKAFSLTFDLRDGETVEQAKALCAEKIRAWIEKRAARGDAAKVEASTRYRVLKAARGKCELCGISAKVSPIDIDHIVPRSQADKHDHILKGGVRMHIDDERNLQALCFRCNRAKRDQDATDFRLPTQKLVRDRIPEIIRASGMTPVTKLLTGEHLRTGLLEKLTEEHAELLAELSLDEVVDMIEVLLALSRSLGHTEADTMLRLQAKRTDRGAFEQGIFLLKVVAPDDPPKAAELPLTSDPVRAAPSGRPVHPARRP
jgi:predicted house-cleaning noncanonical NTP pyrophosphatase (MazG superfamily)